MQRPWVSSSKALEKLVPGLFSVEFAVYSHPCGPTRDTSVYRNPDNSVYRRLALDLLAELGNQHNWSLPECRFLTARVQNGHLAVVAARRQLSQRKIES